VNVYSSEYLKDFLSGKQAQKTWETLRDMCRRELKKLHDTKSDQVTGTTHDSKWQCFTMMFVNAVMIPRPTLLNVLRAEESVLESNPNLKDGNDSTNVYINDKDIDEFNEGVSDERQSKKNLGTKRNINFQDEALYLEKTKYGREAVKKSRGDENYMCLMSLIS